MFCENCGTKLEKDDSFCTNCGNPVKKEENDTTLVDENVTSSDVENVTVEPTVETTVTTSEPIVESTVEAPNLNVNNFNNKEKIKKGASGNAVIILIVMLLVFAAIAVGAYFLLFKKSNKNSIDAIESAINNMSKVESYTLVASLDMESKEENQDVEVSIEANIDSKNKKAKLNASISASGATMEFLGYVDVSDSKDANVYFKLPAALTQTDSKWQKISLGEIDLDSLMEEYEIEEEITEEDKEELKNVLKEINFIESIKSDVEGTNLYRATIDKKSLKELVEKMNDIEVSEEELDELDFEGKIIIDIYIDKKNNYLSKMVMNLKDFYNNLENADSELDKFNLVIEYKDVNEVEEIKIPSEAVNADEFDFASTGLIPGGDIDEDINFDDDDSDLEDETYVDDYSLTDYGYKIKYNLGSDYEASSVNSDDFKIYRTDDIRAILTMRRTDIENGFDDIEYDKKYYDESESYINVVLSDSKKVTVAGKEFTYKELTYKYDSEYGSTYYNTVFCYQIDDEYIYSVTYEKEGSPLTEEEMKTFLDVEITKE